MSSEIEKGVRRGILGAIRERESSSFVSYELIFFTAIIGFYLAFHFKSIEYVFIVIPFAFIFAFFLKYKQFYFAFSIIASVFWGIFGSLVTFLILLHTFNFYLTMLIITACGIITFIIVFRIHRNLG